MIILLKYQESNNRNSSEFLKYIFHLLENCYFIVFRPAEENKDLTKIQGPILTYLIFFVCSKLVISFKII